MHNMVGWKFFRFFKKFKMKRLFLDDERIPLDCATGLASSMWMRGVNVEQYREEWDVVRSYGQFTAWIEKNGLPNVISFDHDLADVPELKEELPYFEWADENGREYTGMDCARWLINYCMDNNKKIPTCLFHTQNTVGYDNMKTIIKNYIKHNED